MIRMLIELPGVTYKNNAIDYSGLFQYIEEFRSHLLKEFESYQGKNEFKQYDYIKYQLEVQTNMKPVFQQIIEKKIYQPMSFDKITEYNRIVRKDYFETIIQKYKIVSSYKADDAINYTLMENNMY